MGCQAGSGTTTKITNFCHCSKCSRKFQTARQYQLTWMIATDLRRTLNNNEDLLGCVRRATAIPHRFQAMVGAIINCRIFLLLSGPQPVVLVPYLPCTLADCAERVPVEK